MRTIRSQEWFNGYYRYCKLMKIDELFKAPSYYSYLGSSGKLIGGGEMEVDDEVYMRLQNLKSPHAETLIKARFAKEKHDDETSKG